MKNFKLNHANIVAYVILLSIGFFMALPFIWMISTSLKSVDEVFVFPPKFIPDKFMWSNYLEAMTEVPFLRFFFNSVYIAIVVTIGTIVSCLLAGYAFAKLKFPGRDFLFFVYLSTMMVPIQVRLVPLYRIMIYFGWLNTHWAVIIPTLTFFSAWGTFIIRQFVLTIPNELGESARLDGCNYLSTFFYIMLPSLKPVMATLGIFVFVGVMNQFLWPLIVLNDIELRTLPLGLTMFQNRIYLRTPWHLVMAAANMSIIPLLIVFIFGQKYYIKGIVTTGLKG